MIWAGHNSNVYRSCIYSYQQAWVLLALPARLKLSTPFNVDAFTSLKLPHALGAPLQRSNPAHNTQMHCKIFSKNRKLPSLQNPCVFLMGKGCTRFYIQETTWGNESVPWGWMTIHASAVVLQGMATLTPMSQQARAGDNSWQCRCQLGCVCRRASLCDISSFLFSLLRKRCFKKLDFPAGTLWSLASCSSWLTPVSLSSLTLFLERFIHVILLWNTSGERNPYLARFMTSSCSDLFLSCLAQPQRGAGKAMACCPWGVPALCALWSCSNSLGYLILCCPEAFILQHQISRKVYKEKQKETNYWKCTKCCCSLVTLSPIAVQTTTGGCLLWINLAVTGVARLKYVLSTYVKCTWILSDRRDEKTLSYLSGA